MVQNYKKKNRLLNYAEAFNDYEHQNILNANKASVKTYLENQKLYLLVYKRPIKK